MNENIHTLSINLEDQLKFIDLEEDDAIKCAELSIVVCRKALHKLKALIVKHKFRTQNEEVKFFKETKPKFLAPLIYHLKVYRIESRKPNEVMKSGNDIFCMNWKS